MKKARMVSGLARGLIAAVFVAIAVTGCSRDAVAPLSAEEKDALTARGREAAKALMDTLGGQLKAAMESGGPMAAVPVCQSVAATLTQSTSDTFDGLDIGRASLKCRNPENEADAVDRRVLERLAKAMAAGEEAPVDLIEPASGDDDTPVRFYKPLVTQELCLKCHGARDEFPPELVELLGELYPEDKATGHVMGDLRGVIRIEFEDERM